MKQKRTSSLQAISINLPKVNVNRKTSKQGMRNNPITFCAATDYKKLAIVYNQLRASSFFRRGMEFEVQAPEFQDVVDALKVAFLRKRKPKVLFVGLGEAAQEFLSDAAVAKDLFKNKPLGKVMDVHCVDLQPKFSAEVMNNLGYLDGKMPKQFDWDNCRLKGGQLTPMFAKDCFEKALNPTFGDELQPRLKSEIVEYGKAVLNDETRTKWGTSIQDFSKQCKKNTYDVISINNVFHYIEDEDAIEIKNNLSEMLKRGGILITDPFDDFYIASKNRLTCQNSGIWEKGFSIKPQGKGLLTKAQLFIYSTKAKIHRMTLPKEVLKELSKGVM